MILILLISFFIFIALLFIPVSVKIVYSYNQNKNYYKIKIKIFKIITIPLSREEDKLKADIKIKNYKKYSQIILKRLNINWKFLYLESKYGFGNPAYTAISYGIIWSILGTLVTAFDIKKPVIKISSECNEKIFTLHIESIFSLYIGNIIYTGFFILKEEICNGRTKY